MAETLLHDQLPENGVFDVACSQFTDKHIVRFTPAAVGGMLTLADLTGYSLKRLGGDNSISSEYPYDTPLSSASGLARTKNKLGIRVAYP